MIQITIVFQCRSKKNAGIEFFSMNFSLCELILVWLDSPKKTA
jgi:hypothetical protein